jgi:hypothetical protein
MLQEVFPFTLNMFQTNCIGISKIWNLSTQKVTWYEMTWSIMHWTRSEGSFIDWNKTATPHHQFMCWFSKCCYAHYTDTILETVHYLRYIWYMSQFGCWPYFLLHVTCYHLIKTRLLLFYMLVVRVGIEHRTF